MTKKNNPLKRKDNIEFTYRNELRTGTVLYSTKSKTVIYLHGGKQTTNRVETITTGNNIVVNPVELSNIEECYVPFIEAVTDIKEGDLVRLADPELGEFIGVLKGIRVDGYHVENLEEYLIFPFTYKIEKTEPVFKEKTMPLDKWTAKAVKSNIEYHEGGLCQKYALFHNNKKVLEIEEDAWGGGYQPTKIAKIGGKNAYSELLTDAKNSFAIAEIPEEKHFYADSAGCIAQWLLIRKLISLKDKFNS